MAAAFLKFAGDGARRRSRRQTLKARCQSGEQENQTTCVLLLMFYRHPRLTPIRIFYVFVIKNNISHGKTWDIWKQKGRGNQR